MKRGKVATARLDALIEEASVDAHDGSEQTTGFFTMLEEHLGFPFRTRVLGTEVVVERIEMTEDERIVAVCTRDRSPQPISILDLPLPDPPPPGSDRILAYRRWAQGGRR